MANANATSSLDSPVGREEGLTPVVRTSRAEQVRRILSEAAVTLGLLGVAVDAYGPDIVKLAPGIKWLPAALAGLGLIVRLWQKVQDLRNITHV